MRLHTERKQSKQTNRNLEKHIYGSGTYRVEILVWILAVRNLQVLVEGKLPPGFALWDMKRGQCPELFWLYLKWWVETGLEWSCNPSLYPNLFPK